MFLNFRGRAGYPRKCLRIILAFGAIYCLINTIFRIHQEIVENPSCFLVYCIGNLPPLVWKWVRSVGKRSRLSPRHFIDTYSFIFMNFIGHLPYFFFKDNSPNSLLTPLVPGYPVSYGIGTGILKFSSVYLWINIGILT